MLKSVNTGKPVYQTLSARDYDTLMGVLSALKPFIHEDKPVVSKAQYDTTVSIVFSVAWFNEGMLSSVVNVMKYLKNRHYLVTLGCSYEGHITLDICGWNYIPNKGIYEWRE